jgi:hypothetical protein
MPTNLYFVTLVVVFACSSNTPYGGGLASAASIEDQSDVPYLLPQRLVRRNFLRFGKRSAASVPSDEEDLKSGLGEVFEHMSMANQAHKSSPRSFLRFGRSSSSKSPKRSDNFLRFGKRSSEDDVMMMEQPEFENCQEIGQSLLYLLCKIKDESPQQSRDKKANTDFLRFG